MTRRLKFDGEKKAMRFKLLREGFFVGGHTLGQKGQPKQRAWMRSEARILDAFDSISHPIDKPGDLERVLNDGEHELEISQEDYDLIDKYLTETPWATPVAREANDMLDWFAAAEKVDA